ncbi:hypothetical protein D3C80_899930 [compost metagenome]
MGALVIAHRAETQAGRRALAQRLGHREVLEHQQAVEQRRALLASPPLDGIQRHMLEFTQAQVEVLHVGQVTGHLAIRRGIDQHRQGIDEQPELVVDARQWRRASGHRGAEGHAGLPGQAL